MAAQTTEGTGPGSAADIKPKIINGVVRDVNIARNALDTYRGLVIVNKDNASGDTYQLTGNMVSTGSIETNSFVEATSYVRGHALGQYLNTSFYTFSSGLVTNSSGTYTDFATVAYTPVSNSSFLLIEYHAPYTVNGNGADDFRSKITVGATEITYRDQQWGSAAGSGTRGSVIFPISMVYWNTVTSLLTIRVSAAQNTANDTLTVDTDKAYLRITEIAR